MDFLPRMTSASCAWRSVSTVPVSMGEIRTRLRGRAERQDSLAAEGLRVAALPLPGWSRWSGFLERGNHLRGTFCLMFRLKEEQKWLFTFKCWYNILLAMEQNRCALKLFVINKRDAVTLPAPARTDILGKAFLQDTRDLESLCLSAKSKTLWSRTSGGLNCYWSNLRWKNLNSE